MLPNTIKTTEFWDWKVQDLSDLAHGLGPFRFRHSCVFTLVSYVAEQAKKQLEIFFYKVTELITFQRYLFWFQHVNFRKTNIQYILIFSWRSENKVNLELFSWSCIIHFLGKGFIAYLLTFCIVSTGDSSVSGFVLHVASSVVCVRMEEETSPY